MTSLELFSKEEATKILVELGMSVNLQGFKYIQDGVTKVIKEPKLIKNVTKVLYPEIGKEYEVSGSVVERSMRHATDMAYFKTGFKALHKIFGIEGEILGYKPSNCELIAMISEALRFKAEKKGLLA